MFLFHFVLLKINGAGEGALLWESADTLLPSSDLEQISWLFLCAFILNLQRTTGRLVICLPSLWVV